MSKSWDIAAYTYRAEILCPTCVIEALIHDGLAAPAARDMNEERVLDQIAEANAIERYNEWSYDSDEFPKVVFEGSLQGEHCDSCGDEL